MITKPVGVERLKEKAGLCQSRLANLVQKCAVSSYHQMRKESRVVVSTVPEETKYSRSTSVPGF
jgi:hypothetical protein